MAIEQSVLDVVQSNAQSEGRSDNPQLASKDDFSDKIITLRAEYRSYPDRFPFWNQVRRTSWDLQRTYLELWCGDALNYVRLIPGGGSLAADILGFRADLPVYSVDLEIAGDSYSVTDHKEFALEEEEEDDTEDCTDELVHLPVITADPTLHFVKKPSYTSELHNLHLCKGSPYVVQLLGRTQGGELVFDKFPSDLFIFSLHNPQMMTVTTVKQFMLHLIDAVSDIHSRGIIHKDLVLRNLLYSGDITRPVVIADVESHWGSGVCAAPEVRDQTNFSPASDVYAISTCLMQFIFAINPRHPFVQYAIPAPFDTVYKACAQEEIHNRPTLAALKRMVEGLS